MSAAAAPETILRELADLWVSLAKPGEGDGGAGVLRACTMTLVVVTEESEDLASLGETVAALMPEHPARAVVVRLHQDASRPVSARVFAQCWMPFGQRRQICCEQVEISAPDAALDGLPSVLLPLMAPDLPVVLWSRSPRLLGMEGFRQLAAMADKTVIDSAALPGARDALRRFSGAAETGLLVADLSWTRLTRWRETLSRIFENRDVLARLPEISRVLVAFGGKAAPPQAWYLGAWAVDSLVAAGAGAQFSLEARPSGPAGRVLQLGLSGDRPGALRVELSLEGETLVSRVDSLSNCMRLAEPTDYLLMREELAVAGRDPVFAKTLASALKLALSSSAG